MSHLDVFRWLSFARKPVSPGNEIVNQAALLKPVNYTRVSRLRDISDEISEVSYCFCEARQRVVIAFSPTHVFHVILSIFCQLCVALG